MAYNPFDDVIDQDPAYMQVGGEPSTTDQKPGYYANMFPNRQQPTTEEATDAFYENVMKPTFGQFYETLGYGVTEQDLEDAKLNNEIMNALQERGIAIEEGRNIPLKGSREYYNMVSELVPALENMGYKPQSVLKRLQQAMYGEAKLGYEALDQEGMTYSQLPENYKAAMHPMYAILDAPDMAALIALPTQLIKQGIKLTPQFVPFIQDLLQKGVGNKEIVQIASKQFPEDMQAIAGINFGPMVEKGQLNLAPDMGGAGGTSVGSTIKIPKYYKDMIDNDRMGSEATRLKVKKALDENPTQAPKSITEMAKDYDMQNYRFLLAEIYKRQAQGKLPANYMLPQAKPGEIAGTEAVGLGTKKAAELSAQKYGPILEKANQLYAQNPDKYKDQGVNFFIEELLLKNPEIDSISDDFLLKNFAYYQALKTPGMKFKGSGKPTKDNQKFLASTMNKYGIYGSERAVSRDNYSILYHTFRHDPKEIEAALKSNGALTKKEFAAQNPKLTPEEVANEYKTYAANVAQKTVDDELIQYIAIKEPQNLEKFKSKIAMRDEFNQWVRGAIDDFFFDPKMTDEKAAFIQKYKNALEEATGKKIKNDNDFRKKLFAIYKADLSHSYPIRSLRKEIPGGAAFADLIKVNFSGLNLGLQAEADGFIRRAIPKIKKLLKQDGGKLSDKSRDQVEQIVEKIRDFNEEFENRLLTSYAKIDDPEVAKILNDYFPDNRVGFETLVDIEDFEGGVTKKTIKSDFILGVPIKQEPTLEELKNYFENHLTRALTGEVEPKFNKKTGSGQGATAGILSKIRSGTLDKSFFNQGGAVHMAMGGDPLQNINQQQFAADPGFDGEDYFSQAVESGNLYAFNPFKLLNIFGKIDGVATPNKVKPSILPPPNADDITPALVPSVEKSDFPFQSFMMEKMYAPNAPKSAPPEAWKQYLLGGNQPVKQAEIQDSGLLQYLDDYAGYFPGKKIDRETLSQYYETSPVGNLSVKIKEANRPPAEAEEANKLFNHSGKSRHKGAGGLRIDEEGTDYREVVIQAGAIPNESQAFVNSSHFEEPNTIGFSRVANYNNMDGDTVAVIQELQTDMLTSLQKEQDRLQAMLKRLDNVKDKLQRDLNSPDIEVRNLAERQMNEINQKFPPDTIEYLKQNPNLIKPFPNEAGKIMIPDYSKELIDLQKQIDELVKAKVDTGVYELDDSIYSIAELQKSIRDKLYDLNRSVELDDQIKGFQVPDQYQRDELANFAQNDRPQLGYSTHDVKLFPNFPFQSQQDYVDLILKATIKDAQTRGIDKIAIMPAEVGPIKRWSKDKNGPSGKKFIDLYDKVTPQVMKNIAKKYDGTLQIEKIVDPSKAEKGLQFFNKDVDGSFSLLKEDVLNGDLSFGEIDSYINGKLEKAAHDMGANNVVYTKEIAPGQTMDYYVQPTTRQQTSMEGVTGTVSDFELVPLGPGDDINAAQLHIVETNPQLVDMYTLTLNSPKAQEPFFLYGKKDGGKIASDGLVSITDIYGDY